MKNNKKSVTFLKQRSYVIAAVLMLVAVFGMTGVYMSEQAKEKKQQEIQAKKDADEKELIAKNKEKKEDSKPVEQIIKPENTDFLDAPDEVATKEEEVQPETEPEPEAEPAADETQETLTVNEPQQPEIHFEAETELGWPLQGNVILNYSMDQTIYFATLDQYKYNPAVVIQGQVNDKILSVADGKISNIETNEETGCTVTVDLGDGYSAVYGQLKEVPVHAGDYIEAGSIIGYVSEPTKYYSLEGPNLYFQLLKDNASVNPMEYFQ